MTVSISGPQNLRSQGRGPWIPTWISTLVDIIRNPCKGYYRSHKKDQYIQMFFAKKLEIGKMSLIYLSWSSHHCSYVAGSPKSSVHVIYMFTRVSLRLVMKHRTKCWPEKDISHLKGPQNLVQFHQKPSRAEDLVFPGTFPFASEHKLDIFPDSS